MGLQPGRPSVRGAFQPRPLEHLFWDLGEGPYNAKILQRPSPPGGLLFKLKHFQRYEKPLGLYELIAQSWDPAVVDTETAAYSVCTTWGVLGQKLYLFDVLRKRLDFHKIEPTILHMKEKWNAGCVVLETSGVGLAWQRAHQTGGRAAMALSSRPKTWQGRASDRPDAQGRTEARYLPVGAPWLESFDSEVATFPNSKYADQVDSMVQFLTHLDHRVRWTINLTAFRDHREQPV